MANMSYCRFHNTLIDLVDCEGALEDFLDNDEKDAISSDSERSKAKQLIELCHEIADNWDPEDIDAKAEYFKEIGEEGEEAGE